MSFVSFFFYFYLAAAVLLFYLLPGRWRVPYLLLISCVFYASISPKYLALMLALTALIFRIGIRLRSTSSGSSRKALLLAGLLPALGSLVLFKAGSGFARWLIPIGISYYTFKLMSYLVEVYWDESQAVGSLVDFGSYITFGPQMVSGPIQRPFDYFPQLARVKEGKADFERINSGMQLILGGLLLKLLIGDKLGAFIDLIDKNPTGYTRAVVWTSTLCYSIQLYADFAGYTNIALGLGKLFGIDGPPNFNGPFSAANIQDFWRRWHMSLTTWLTDYVFMPLRMSTRRLQTGGLVMSLVITFVLIGVWHGLAWTFLIFGLVHGVFMTVSALTLTYRDRFFAGYPAAIRQMRVVWGIAATYLLVTFSQIWFWAVSPHAALLRIEQLAGLAPSGALAFADIQSVIVIPLWFCIPLAFYLGAGSPGIAATVSSGRRIYSGLGLQRRRSAGAFSLYYRSREQVHLWSILRNRAASGIRWWCFC